MWDKANITYNYNYYYTYKTIEMTKKEKQKKINKLQKKLIKALEKKVIANKNPYNTICDLIDFDQKCVDIKDQIKAVKNTPETFKIVGSFPIINHLEKDEELTINIKKGTTSNTHTESFPSITGAINFVNGFINSPPNIELVRSKITLKMIISDGEYYMIHRHHYKGTELNISIPKTKEPIRYNVYIYLLAGKVRYSCDELPKTTLAMPLYKLEVLANGAGTKVELTDQRGLINI